MNGKEKGVLAALVLAACVGGGAWWYSTNQDPLELIACEHAVMALLKSPATYKRADIVQQETRIFLNYDAANAFGTPMRGLAICDFKMDATGRPDLVALQIGGRKMSGYDIDFMLAQAKATTAVLKHSRP